MKMKQCLAGAVMVLAGAVMAEEIFREGFNAGFVPPYQTGSGTFGFQFVNHANGQVHGLNGTEGDGYGWQNSNNQQKGGQSSVIGRMTVDLGTVKEAGLEYVFTGDFAWRFGTEACAKDLFIAKDRTGFRIGGKTRGAEGNWKIGNTAEKVWSTYTVRYTTKEADVGEKIEFEIQLVDNNQAAGLTQLLTDNWRVQILSGNGVLGGSISSQMLCNEPVIAGVFR